MWGFINFGFECIQNRFEHKRFWKGVNGWNGSKVFIIRRFKGIWTRNHSQTNRKSFVITIVIKVKWQLRSSLKYLPHQSVERFFFLFSSTMLFNYRFKRHCIVAEKMLDQNQLEMFFYIRTFFRKMVIFQTSNLHHRRYEGVIGYGSALNNIIK